MFQAHAVAEYGMDKSAEEEFAFIWQFMQKIDGTERIRKEADRVDKSLAPFRAACKNPGEQG
eukprot:1094477-Prymnesium_polylepis.1